MCWLFIAAIATEAYLKADVLSTVLRKSVAFLRQGNALTMQVGALTMQANALTM
ncbi:MAG: hypothetical protein V7K66_33475 [Nostoc sp.]